MENKDDKEGKRVAIWIILVLLGLAFIVIYELAAFGVRTAHNMADGGWVWALVVLVPLVLFFLLGRGKKTDE